MAFWHDPAYSAFWLGVARGELATWIQLTPYVYAILEAVHLVGVTFFFGSIFVLDLRLLGLMPQIAPESASRFLLSVSAPAFALIVASGILLFIPSADRHAESMVFFVKCAAIAAGGGNALAFHRMARRPAGVWGDAVRARRPARLTAIVSMTVWIGVIVLGRAMGYERRKPPEVDLDALPVFGAVLAENPIVAEPLPSFRPDGAVASGGILGAD
jgi:hypothetical protein